MAYSWFRAESAAVDHPKVMELAVMLKVELALADGYVFRLWSWVQRYAPVGAFSARVVPQLEAYIGRAGVIEVMRATGLLDAAVGVDAVEFSVHDWEEFQGGNVEKSKRDAKMRKKSRRVFAARRNGAAALSPRVQDRTGQDTTEQDRTNKKQEAAPHPIELLKLWNQVADPALPRAQDLTDTRHKHATARLRERPALDQWRGIVERINTSDFCRGQNDRGWVASFDWMLKPDTPVKVLEGKYDNRAGTGPPGAQLGIITAPAAQCAVCGGGALGRFANIDVCSAHFAEAEREGKRLKPDTPWTADLSQWSSSQHTQAATT